MKIYIGPYANYRNLYKIGEYLNRLFNLPEDKCDVVCDFLKYSIGLGKICDYINRPKKRKVLIQIHEYDTWNMDSTLAMIILPMLMQLKSHKKGAPLVSDEDVPSNLKTDKAPANQDPHEYHAFLNLRWQYVLNEMTWTFEQLQPDSHWEDQYYLQQKLTDTKGYTEHNERINKGLMLFGKYFRNLWD